MTVEPDRDAADYVADNREMLESLANRDGSEPARELSAVVRGLLDRHDGGDT